MAFIGKLVWNALGWAMPGLSAGPFYLAAGVLVLSLTASVAYFKGADGKGAAMATEKAACELRITEGARLAAESMADLIEHISKDQPPEPANAAEEAKLCADSKLCRKVKK